MACSGVTRDELVAMSGVTRDELVAMSGVRRGAEVAKPQKRSNPAHASITRGPLRRGTRWACCFLAKQKLRQLRHVGSNAPRLVALKDRAYSVTCGAAFWPLNVPPGGIGAAALQASHCTRRSGVRSRKPRRPPIIEGYGLMRRALSLLAKATISILLLYLSLHSVDVGALGARLSRFEFGLGCPRAFPADGSSHAACGAVAQH